MTRWPHWKIAPWFVLLLAPLPLSAQTPEPKGPDLSAFKTVESAITTKIAKTAATQVSSPGFFSRPVGSS